MSTQVFTTIDGLNAALRKLPKDTVSRLRDASVTIAAKVASDAQGRAQQEGKLAALVGPSIRATRDKVPVVRMGGATRLPDSGAGWSHSRKGSHQTVGDVLFGSEFGGGRRPTTQQFLPWLGHTGYFLWPSVRADDAYITTEYSAALNKALQDI